MRYTFPIRTRSSSQNPTLTFNNTKIECLASCKYLSIHLDPNLDLKSHIQHLETKIAKSVGILSKLRFLLPKSTLRLLYYALIHPHLLYALPVWGSTFPTFLTKLQRLKIKQYELL